MASSAPESSSLPPSPPSPSPVEPSFLALNTLLEAIRSALEEAEDCPSESKPFHDLLRELRAASYDAEDFLGDCERHLPSAADTPRRKRWEEVSPSLASSTAGLRARDFVQRLEGIWTSFRAAYLSEKLGSLSDAPVSFVVGRDRERDDLVRVLTSSNERRDAPYVTAIVGDEGVGKTTLTQLVYNDARVLRHFDMRAWISFPEDFTFSNLLVTIIRSLSGSGLEGGEDRVVQALLMEILRARRLLVVLDDVLLDDQREWESFLAPLAGTATIKIVVISEQKGVADIVKAARVFYLNSLSFEDSWRLFKQCAFGDHYPDAKQDLIDTGRGVVMKCGGLPLFVKAIGSALRYEPDACKWADVLHSRIWKFKLLLSSALQLSYKSMPDHLIPCFTYCSFFPNGYTFKRSQLVRLWIAQGLVEPGSCRSVDDVGSEYFDELVKRSFIQLSGSQGEDSSCDHSQWMSQDHDSYFGGYYNEERAVYTMHSLILDVSYANLEDSEQEDHIYQHKLVLPHNCASLKTYMYIDISGQQSVSLRSKNMAILTNLFLKSRSLRAVVLSSGSLNTLPDSLGKLKNLRYLCLKCNITSLPPSVCELHNLQTLDLLGCACLEKLPRDIGKLRELRHLDLPSREALQYPKNTRAPICQVDLPGDIHWLHYLQNLPGIHVGKDHCGIAALKELVHLRGGLIISGLRNLTSLEEAKEANLKSKESLQMLIYEWDDVIPSRASHENGRTLKSAGDIANAAGAIPEKMESVLESLQPHTNLTMLVISSYGGVKFPHWVGDPSFSRLASVILDGREETSCRFLPPLGQLNCLRSLFIARMNGIQSVGREFCCLSTKTSVTAFPSLLDLTFEDMGEWEIWYDLMDGDFPCLRKLTIYNCSKLRGIPFLPSLTSMCLYNIPEILVIRTSTKLESLEIDSSKSLRSLSLHPNTHALRVLKISHCPCLTLLTGLCNQISLERLAMCYCPVLRLPPSEHLLCIPNSVCIRSCHWLTEWCQRIGICQPDVVQQSRSSVEPELSALTSRSVVYGREIDEKRVLDLVLSDISGEHGVAFICIVAASGVGKTTLAHLVYSNPRVRLIFEILVWVSASEEFGVEDLLKAIIKSITGIYCHVTELSKLQKIIEEELGNKRFLLVLEDLQSGNESFWNSLLVSLRVGGKGSIVLATTRENMASTRIDLLLSYQLNRLSDDDCWLIFQEKAFHGRDPNAHPNLVEIGKKIVPKCAGVPLIAKVLGGLLQSSTDEVLWKHALQIGWSVKDKLQDKHLLGLKLFYDCLPVLMKQCFSYCSLFPKGYVFDKDHLVRLWLAQGLIVDEEDSQAEDIGDGYFEELFRRLLFQRIQVSDADEEKFVIHDLIFIAIQLLVGNEIVRMEGKDFARIPTEVHHISFVPCNSTTFLQLKALKRFTNLHTFMLITSKLDGSLFHIQDTDILSDLFQTLRSLRTLDLSYTNIKELPESVGLLENLCYLSLNGTKVRRLPETVGKLCKLQTLELKDCNFLRLPKDTKNLANLRHLDVQKELGFVQMPSGIGQLSGLRTLPQFYIGGDDRGCGLGELRDMLNLRGKLHIAGLENVRSAEDAKQADLMNKKHIRSLALQWCDGGIDAEGIERAAGELLEHLRPNANLVELTIQDYFGALFPTWISDPSFSKLMSITLDNCCECDKFPTLGQLPSLKYICIQKMHSVEHVGREFCEYDTLVVNSFPSLETLKVEEMYKWNEWVGVGDTDFPNLCHLSINRCLELRNLPSFTFLAELSILDCTEMPEIQELPSLKSLKIDGVRNLDFLALPPVLPVLEKLEISHCNELLSVANLCYLPSMKQLKTTQCPKLYFSENDKLPATLQLIEIHCSCSSLSKWNPDGFGEDTGANQASRKLVRQNQQKRALRMSKISLESHTEISLGKREEDFGSWQSLPYQVWGEELAEGGEGCCVQ